MIVETQYFTFAQNPHVFELENGQDISPVTLAYEAYGTLNEAGSNAILITHGFTAGAHAAGVDKQSGAAGWWDNMIGPGKAFDTNQYYIVSSNVLGGCNGSTGPSSINPATEKPYGSSFPAVTILDMVRAQYELLTGIGVKSLASVCGASMGGQQALQWMISYPYFVRTAVPIACSGHLSSMGLALSEVSRCAIVSDSDWSGGDYYGKSFPDKGLAVARMAAHLTYISDEYLDGEFGRRPATSPPQQSQAAGDFAVQEYLRDEGQSFIKRFDANSFLHLSQAIEDFDLTKDGVTLEEALKDVVSKVCLISFSTDWLFPVKQIHALESAMHNLQIDTVHYTVETKAGHDAFLTEWQKISPLIAEFLRRAAL
jgi:homoserine O-acetyltransferase